MNELQEAFEREADLAERLSSAEAKVEEMEQAIGYVMRAWHHDRPHLPWSIHQLEKAYPEWKDRYPHYKAGAE